MGNVICIVVGASIILLGVFEKRFHVGLSRGAKISAPAWQGRTWFFISGTSIALMGVAGITGAWHAVIQNFAARAVATFDAAYEAFGGTIAVLVGLVFAWGGRDKVEFQGRLMGVGVMIFGAVLISDAVWKLTR